MASKGGFEGDVGEVERRMGQIAGRTRDIAQNLERAADRMADFGRMADESSRKVEQIRDRMRRANDAGNRLEFDKLGRDFDKFARKTLAYRGLDKLSDGFEKVARGIIKMNAGMLTNFFGWLGDSIKRVYELQERWTKAIGGFNMRLGGLTSGLKGAQKAATAWSGTIRGLTNGDIFEGIQMFEEFTLALGKVIDKGDEFQRFGIQLARGFNLGGDAAGRMTRVFSNMGISAGEAAQTMTELAEGANMVGTPVNLLAKDVSEANDYMVRFGKQGARVFVTAAAYARKFSMSMSDLQKATEKFDLFDNAAKTAATINTVFGTMVNSVDLMLQDDPAARIESIRKSLLAQGYTYERLAPKQIRLLSEELGVTNEQVASLLSLKNASFSYQEMQAKQLAKEKTEAQAKRSMELALRKTAQTMYAFGAAFDRITVAVSNAIRPILEVLGLAKSGGKDFRSFGEVMESVTKHIVLFFNSLAKNERWQSFMRELAADLVKAGRAVSEFVTSGKAVQWAGKVASVMKSVYEFARDAFTTMLSVGRQLAPLFMKLAEHSKEIVAVYVGGKALSTGLGVGLKIKEMARSSRRPGWDERMIDPLAARAMGAGGYSVRGGGGGKGGIDWASATGSPFAEPPNPDANPSFNAAAPAARGGRFSRMRSALGGGRGAAAMGALSGVGVLLAGGSASSAAGASLGGALGGFIAGPLGAAIGSFAGDAIVTLGRRLLRSSHEKEMENLQERLEAAQRRRADQQERFNGQMELLEKRREISEARRQALDSTLGELQQRSKKKSVDLSKEEAEAIRGQSRALSLFAGSNKDARDALAKLSQPENGPISLTSRELAGLQQVSALYQQELEKLQGLTAGEAQTKLAEAQAQGQVSSQEYAVKSLEAELKRGEKTSAYAQKFIDNPVQAFAETAGISFNDALGKIMTNPKLQKVMRDQEAANRRFLDERQMKEEKLKREQAKLVDLQTNNERKIFVLKYRNELLRSEEFLQFRKENEGKGVAQGDLQNRFFLRMLQQSTVDRETYRDLVSLNPLRMAGGGVVARPTVAMIGESGPEAVVPLRASARSTGPGRGSSGAVARSLVNYAVGGTAAAGAPRTVFVAGDVYLDSSKVGRVIVGEAMKRVEG